MNEDNEDYIQSKTLGFRLDGIVKAYDDYIENRKPKESKEFDDLQDYLIGIEGEEEVNLQVDDQINVYLNDVTGNKYIILDGEPEELIIKRIGEMTVIKI
jgi:hypothetical protein